PFERQYAQSIEAAEMRADEQHALPAFEHSIELSQTERLNIEALETLAQQEQPVENRAREAMDVAQDMPHRRAMPEHSFEIDARSTPLRSAPEKEIQRDRIQQEPRYTPPATEREIPHEMQDERVADLLPFDPRSAHERADCEVASAKAPCA